MHQKPFLKLKHLLRLLGTEERIPDAGHRHIDDPRVLAAAAGFEMHLEIVPLLRGTDQQGPNFSEINRGAGSVLQE